MLFVFSGIAVGAALLVGLFLLIPGVRDVWRRAGHWSLLLSAVPLGVMIFATKLGLRTLDPVSHRIGRRVSAHGTTIGLALF